MQYPICIEWGDEHTATGIQIPDIPGAVTAGDTFEAAYSAAIEIAHVMLEELAREASQMRARGAFEEERKAAEEERWGRRGSPK